MDNNQEAPNSNIKFQINTMKLATSNKQQVTSFRIPKDKKEIIQINKPGEYRIELLGEGAEVEIGGVFEASGSESKEVCVIIVHKAGHTRANTTLKGVARDKAFLKFVGRIIIDKGCPDTNSFLTEKILLLSDTARAEAVPDLEIESDDVKCSHAATISNLDEEQIFYLKSRGIPRIQAEKMLVEGFLG